MYNFPGLNPEYCLIGLDCGLDIIIIWQIYR